MLWWVDQIDHHWLQIERTASSQSERWTQIAAEWVLETIWKQHWLWNEESGGKGRTEGTVEIRYNDSQEGIGRVRRQSQQSKVSDQTLQGVVGKSIRIQGLGPLGSYSEVETEECRVEGWNG
jgi:hypothetical protein